jgi:hypothetical protein
MEHSLHLAAKHFVQAVAPHHKTHAPSVGDNEGDSASDGGEDDDDDGEAIDAGDSLRKAIALVKQVSHSIYLMIFCTNMCYRFVSRLKLGRSSMQPAPKSGSPRWSSCCGFAHAGGRSLASLSVLLNSEWYVYYLSEFSKL